MDDLKKLSYDVKTYKELIKAYTSDPFINQTVANLEECINSNDLSGILFFLDRLKNWYERKIYEIRINSLVINHESHELALQQINEYFLKISSGIETQEIVIKDDNIMNSTQGYKIFISHSSKDEKICTAFVNLLEILGVPEENILYSSSERFGIPADMDIFNYLKSSIAERFNVYYMLSDNYYKSVYCLNEMGAAWVNQNDFSTFILPNFTGSIQGVIDSNKKGFRLDNVINLNQLRDKITKDFNSTISTNKWDEEKEKFMKILKND